MMSRARDNRDLGSTYKETPGAGYDGMATLGETRGDLAGNLGRIFKPFLNFS